MIDDLQRKFKLPVGISDHTHPKDSHDILLLSAMKNMRMIKNILQMINQKKEMIIFILL